MKISQQIFIDPLCNNGWVLRGHTTPNCHMFTIGDIEYLHNFAKIIGMKRSWFQNKTIPHYDLTDSRRLVAVSNGAQQVDRREAVRLWKENFYKK